MYQNTGQRQSLSQSTRGKLVEINVRTIKVSIAGKAYGNIMIEWVQVII